MAAIPASQISSLPLTPDTSPGPVSPASDGSQQQNSQSGPVRRKPSRRANTAERRATHNAVERQRRETLNGRFLDLAALLPNLASVRRPSKSAIVNSSIALIHTQRRARALAGREMRILKAETDLLRRELNEWRDRASLPRSDEPPRSAEFAALMVLEEADESHEEEVRRAYEMAAIPLGGEDDLEYGDFDPQPPALQQQQQEFVPQQQAPVQQQQYAPQPRMPVSVQIPTHFEHQQQLFAEPQPMSAQSQQQQQWRPQPSQTQHYATPPSSAHGVRYAPYPLARYDDDGTSSSGSGGGSPPASAVPMPLPHHHAQHPQHPFEPVPALIAGATPADYARFWAPAGQTQQQPQRVGYPMGYAM